MTTAVDRQSGKASVPEQHDLGDGDRFGVSDGDEAAPHLHAGGAPGGTAVQLQLRRPADPHHLDVLPQHSARMAGAEGFHRRFLGGEPPRQVRDRIAAARTISDLLIGEDPVQEAVAVALQRLRDPWQVGRVQSDSDDVHVSAPA